jgi:hypothetical protein
MEGPTPAGNPALAGRTAWTKFKPDFAWNERVVLSVRPEDVLQLSVVQGPGEDGPVRGTCRAVDTLAEARRFVKLVGAKGEPAGVRFGLPRAASCVGANRRERVGRMSSLRLSGSAFRSSRAGRRL